MRACSVAGMYPNGRIGHNRLFRQVCFYNLPIMSCGMELFPPLARFDFNWPLGGRLMKIIYGFRGEWLERKGVDCRYKGLPKLFPLIAQVFSIFSFRNSSLAFSFKWRNRFSVKKPFRFKENSFENCYESDKISIDTKNEGHADHRDEPLCHIRKYVRLTVFSSGLFDGPFIPIDRRFWRFLALG